MSIGFKEIDDSIAILKYKRSFKQAKLYERGGLVYAKDGGGFIKLAVNGSTTNCDIKWLELEGVKLTNTIKGAMNMKLKKVSKQPASGQFVAVWMHNGALWCATYLWVSGRLKQYNAEKDNWFTADDGEQDKEYYVKAD